MLVVFEDLHLAGASPRELLHFLLRWERAAPLLVVATVRSEEGDEAIDQLGPLAALVELGPLPEAAVEELAAAMGLRDRAAEAPPARASQALERIAAQLPERLRADFLARGAVSSRRR